MLDISFGLCVNGLQVWLELESFCPQKWTISSTYCSIYRLKESYPSIKPCDVDTYKGVNTHLPTGTEGPSRDKKRLPFRLYVIAITLIALLIVKAKRHEGPFKL